MAQHGWSPTNPVEKADQPTLQPSRNEILVDLRIPTKLICKQFEALIAQHPKFRIYQAKFGNSQKPDLIILEPDFDHHLTMAFIASVKKDDKGPDIFLTASQPDISLMVEALRAGVREFFLQPIQEPEILEALDRCATRFHARHNASPRKMGKIISVLGGRGGIGTTSFVVNLGAWSCPGFVDRWVKPEGLSDTPSGLHVKKVSSLKAFVIRPPMQLFI